MDGGSKPRTHREGQHASMIAVACTKASLTLGGSVGVVQHGKLTAVKRRKSPFHIHLAPSPSEVGGRLDEVVHNRTRKSKTDGPVPTQALQRFTDLEKHIIRVKGSTVLKGQKRTCPLSRSDVVHPDAEPASAEVNPHRFHALTSWFRWPAKRLRPAGERSRR